ncbi:NADH dehydrogenase 1 alpha subcomplex assembly factor 3 [Crassisporium funariophilum]|nr:NADH dehydrogenase 1 alpha subcomplex assembly factor 3 [Crassisporium funariophilum]
MSVRLILSRSRTLARAGISSAYCRSKCAVQAAPSLGRNIHQTRVTRDRSFTNFLADDNPPPVQVSSISENGIVLADGLLIPGSCLFLEGKVYLWDVPEIPKAKGKEERWSGWSEERFQIFDVVTPKPEILLLGTGKTLVQPPPFLRPYLSKLGIQLDVMDTRNACSTYNLLAEEGRRVAAALMPLTPHPWHKTTAVSGHSAS